MCDALRTNCDPMGQTTSGLSLLNTCSNPTIAETVFVSSHSERCSVHLCTMWIFIFSLKPPASSRDEQQARGLVTHFFVLHTSNFFHFQTYSKTIQNISYCIRLHNLKFLDANCSIFWKQFPFPTNSIWLLMGGDSRFLHASIFDNSINNDEIRIHF